MEAANPTDWKTEKLPSKRTLIQLDRTFSKQEMKRIRNGLVPEQQEDKWFVYWKENTLFFHRSWTGYCVYVVRFATEGKNFRMVEADVNRDSKQYSETDDGRDAEMISYLIDVLLLHQMANLPCDETNPEQHTLMQWSLVGRAMLGQHPQNE